MKNYQKVTAVWEEGGKEKSGEFLVPDGWEPTECVRGYLHAVNVTKPPDHPTLTFLRISYENG